MDYLFQRHNEFLNGLAGTVQELSYANYLQQAMGDDKDYLSTSSPFSPYSTDLGARNLVIMSQSMVKVPSYQKVLLCMI
jgi:hypothetical protein